MSCEHRQDVRRGTLEALCRLQSASVSTRKHSGAAVAEALWCRRGDESREHRQRVPGTGKV